VTLAQGGVILDSNGFNSTFSGTFTGPGGLTKINAGTVILTADNSYSGDTAIQEGTLVAGTPSAAQKISTALGTGNVFLGGGTLRTTSATSGKPLQINVGGAYTQDPGGTLALGIGGLLLGQYDHVFAQGNATVNGTLEVSSLNGFRPSAGDAFAVLLTKGTRTGLFDHLNDFFNNNPNITARLQPVEVYAPNGVALVYVAAAPGQSPNPIPPIIDVIPTPLPPVALEEPLPLSFVVAALNPTIEQLTSMFEIPFSGANTQRFNLDNRLAEIQRGSTGFVSTIPTVPQPEAKAIVPQGKSVVEKQSPVFQPTRQNRWGVWVNGWGDWASVDDDASIKGYNFTTGGGSVGIDYRITDCLAVGLFGTYAHTWTSLSPGNVEVDTGRGGLYATYWNQGFYVNGGVYGGYNSYDTSRQTLLRGRFANGSTEGYEISTFLEAGYDFHFGNFTVGPIGAVQYTNVHIDGYTEHGSFLPLQIHEDSEESWRTDLGLQASYTWHVGNVVVIPIAQALWEHEYKYSALPITFGTAIFPGATATVFGPDEGHDGFIINAGAGVQWTPRISTFVGYQGQVGRSNYSANGVTGSISFSF
jgi:fibronectin-binding autotransporter adhesin